MAAAGPGPSHGTASDLAAAEELTRLREELVALRQDHLEILKVIQQQQEHLVEMQRAAARQGGTAGASPSPTSSSSAPPPAASPDITASEATLKEAKLPSTSLRRALGFGGLAARLAVDVGSRRVFGKRDGSPGVLSHKALDALVDRLCRMRGAALKLGQMLSIQDSKLVPPHVLQAFARVREQSYSMPQSQLRAMLESELGAGWESKFKAFNLTPVAAASLGQVHKATLPDGRDVAVKVQFEGVSDSIASDVSNLRWLFSFGILPKGLYVDNVLRELQRELTRECDYIGEAERQTGYRAALEADSEREGGLAMIRVPQVVEECTTRRVLTTEWVDGESADCLFEESLPQAERDAVGEAFLRLTLKELFEWRTMQTDPSFANFMYDSNGKSFYLIDFGAARTFEQTFVEQYLLIVYGSTVRDRNMVLEASRRLGFLTGEEGDVMLDAHVEAAFLASIPFATRGVADFGEFDLSTRMAPHVSTMLEHRLTAPPLEVYSLHRRLNGCFQLMTRLGAKVNCRRVFVDVLRGVLPSLSPEVRQRIDLRY
eukprot:TRINITY_DN37496_c0_g1_i2.p1 TRINITY_DN37496_c0_g1~~TRINITY_DN37496_c0_g1_i2.p1  ORF type:complete len:585 (+),score=198.03 TRINITY_DN37496_c0_g1_i2:123-1757(+)